MRGSDTVLMWLRSAPHTVPVRQPVCCRYLNPRRISHGQRAHLFWVNAFSLASSWVDHDEPGLLEALLAIAPAAF